MDRLRWADEVPKRWDMHPYGTNAAENLADLMHICELDNYAEITLIEVGATN